jgi:hypothetical protein
MYLTCLLFTVHTGLSVTLITPKDTQMRVKLVTRLREAHVLDIHSEDRPYDADLVAMK